MRCQVVNEMRQLMDRLDASLQEAAPEARAEAREIFSGTCLMLACGRPHVQFRLRHRALFGGFAARAAS